MRKFLGLLLLFTFLQVAYAQNTDPKMVDNLFLDDWKKIDELNRKRQPQSAKAELDALEAKLVEPFHWPHRVKLHYYRAQNVDADTLFAMWMPQFNIKLDAATGAEKALLAGLMARTLIENQFSLNYTEEAETPPADYNKMDAWSQQTTDMEVQRLYMLALADESLQQVDAGWLNILTDQKSVWADSYRPSVWDILAFDALNWLSSSDRYRGRSAFDFVFDHEAAFSDVSAFIATDFGIARHPQSHMAQAVGLCQRILKRYQQLPLPILAEAHRQILIFGEAHNLHPKKNQLLEARRKASAQTYAGTEASWHIQLNLAFPLVDRDCNDTTNHTAIKEGLALLESIAKCPFEYLSTMAQNKLLDLRTPNLKLYFESVYAPSQAGLFSIEYKNLSEAFVEIRQAKDARFFKNTSDELSAKSIWQWPVIRTISVTLPVNDVLCTQRTEWYFEGLPPGIYAASFRTQESEKVQVRPLVFQVSNLTYLESHTEDNRKQLIVADRLTGRPLSGAVVEQMTRLNYYDKKEDSKVVKTQSDQAGFAYFDNNGGISIYNITYQQTTLYGTQQSYGHYSTNQEGAEQYRQTMCFTDRAIYRPGQTVYFKIYRFVKTGHDVRAVSGEKLTVAFNHFTTR
jgi:hypothetical protein